MQTRYSVANNFSHAFIHIFAGREQVSVGIVPINLAVMTGKGTSGSQSALAVYPIAIANCAEKR